MKRRAFLAGVGAMSVGGSALLASGAYSRGESQRDVTIETVGDDDAYLRLIYSDADVDCSGRVRLVKLTNQFKEKLTTIEVHFEPSNDDISFGNLEMPKQLGVGETGYVTIEASCESNELVTATVTFDIKAWGEETSVKVQDRAIEVSCTCRAGCTPGFWCNQPQNRGWWTDTDPVGGYYTDDLVGDVFDDDDLTPGWLGDLAGKELGEAVCESGPGGDLEAHQRRLARHATAALLNAAHADINYPLTESDVVAAVQEAIDSVDTQVVEETKDEFDEYNNLGCSIDAHGNPRHS